EPKGHRRRPRVNRSVAAALRAAPNAGRNRAGLAPPVARKAPRVRRENRYAANGSAAPLAPKTVLGAARAAWPRQSEAGRRAAKRSDWLADRDRPGGTGPTAAAERSEQGQAW